MLHLRIVWKGGATTTQHIPLKISSIDRLSFAKELKEKIIEMATNSIPDDEIAKQLTQQGYRSPMSDKVLLSTVSRLRLSNGIYVVRGEKRRRVAGHITVTELAKELGVNLAWIYHSIYDKRLLISKDPKTKLYLFPDNEETIEKIKTLKRKEVKQVSFLK